MQILDYRKHEKLLRQPLRDLELQELGSEEFHVKLQELQSLLKKDGVGLAASQVGWAVRVFVLSVDESGNPSSDITTYINPVIHEYSKQTEREIEGCLSFKGVFIPIERATSIKWSYTDLLGNRLNKESHGFFARVIQHETDHCYSRLFIDRATTVVRLKAEKMLRA